uniref:Nucleobase-ascorbate transporter 11 n=1 Tax=Fagus sylvatica TaxID=28930 RepID=A0A2N9EF56_FAGSY
METGSSSESLGKAKKVKAKGGSIATRLGSMLPKVEVEPFVSRIDHNPNELRSWAKRTGFVSDFSGESRASAGDRNDSVGFDLEKGLDHRHGGGSSPKIEIDPVLGRTKKNQGIEIETVGRRIVDKPPVLGPERKVGLNGIMNRTGNGNGNEVPAVSPGAEPKKEDGVAERDAKFDVNPEVEEAASGGWRNPSGMKCGLRDNPGFVSLMYYGLQHYLSLAGSLIFIPLIIVPAMGGTDKDTSNVISTVLLVSGITTILHSYFGTRLPLVQGSSFVYLAPALVIINAKEYRNLTDHSILGFSGLMSFFLRLINPVVVAPTVAAVGLAFFSYGFPQAGSCVEISIPQILLLLIFTLVSDFQPDLDHSVLAGGAYNYKGCSPDIPSSNMLIDSCKKHAYTMKHCRTDVSNAWRTAEWVRVPYPFQWGIPIFHLRTSMIMIIVSLVASVDSVNSKPPTPGIVSRGIALEGLCSLLAGLWGSGTGSTTLTENVHTIDITKVANRRAVEVGAGFLILFSFVDLDPNQEIPDSIQANLSGKVGALLASIPPSMAASILCFMWALIVALGLSTLQYSQTASFRNITIVGVSLFLGLSIPAYFQQYQPDTSLILPSYFVPYAAASNGPAHTGSKQLDFAINGLMSLNMVVTLLVAFVLDNTVPGSRQERGVYIWSRPEEIATDPSFLSDYALPRKVAKCFCWAKCLGV